MKHEDYLEIKDNTIHCENCVFDSNCEELFDTCVSNYAKDYETGKTCHLKYCELINWNELDEEQQAYFLQNVLSKLNKNDKDNKEGQHP